MSKVISRFLSRFRKHDYVRIDFAYATVANHSWYAIPRYKCTKCGEMLHLNEWQMKALPPEMKYNCRGLR